jgi:hypothetical protein
MLHIQSKYARIDSWNGSLERDSVIVVEQIYLTKEEAFQNDSQELKVANSKLHDSSTCFLYPLSHIALYTALASVCYKYSICDTCIGLIRFSECDCRLV